MKVKQKLFALLLGSLSGLSSAHIYQYSFDWQFSTQPTQFSFEQAVPGERYFFGGVATPQDMPVLTLDSNREPTKTKLLLKVTGLHSHEYMNGYVMVQNGSGEISRFGLLLPEGMTFDSDPSTARLFQTHASDSNVIDRQTTAECGYVESSRPLFRVMFSNIKDVTNHIPSKRTAQRGMVEITMQNPIVSGCIDKIFTSVASTFLNGPYVRYSYGPFFNNYSTTKDNLLNVSMLKQIYEGNRHLQPFSGGSSSVSESNVTYALRTPVGSFFMTNREVPSGNIIPSGKGHVGFRLIRPYVRPFEMKLPEKSGIDLLDPTGSLGSGGFKQKPDFSDVSTN